MKETSYEVSFVLCCEVTSLLNQIKARRAQMGLTQQALAQAVGVTGRTIISLETGRYNPSLLLAYRIALALEMPMEELYCLAENKREEDLLNEWAEK